MIHDLGGGFSGEENVELFSAATEGLSSAGHPCQAGRDQAQDLVARVMAVGVVETLEVIDVYDRDRIRSLQPEKRVIKGASRLKRGEFVVIGKKVGILDDRNSEDAGCGDRVHDRDAGYSSKAQRQ